MIYALIVVAWQGACAPTSIGRLCADYVVAAIQQPIVTFRTDKECEAQREQIQAGIGDSLNNVIFADCAAILPPHAPQ